MIIKATEWAKLTDNICSAVFMVMFGNMFWQMKCVCWVDFCKVNINFDPLPLKKREKRNVLNLIFFYLRTNLERLPNYVLQI